MPKSAHAFVPARLELQTQAAGLSALFGSTTLSEKCEKDRHHLLYCRSRAHIER